MSRSPDRPFRRHAACDDPQSAQRAGVPIASRCPRHPVRTQAGRYSVGRRRAAKPVTVPAGPSLSAADVAAHYGQRPPHEGEHAAVTTAGRGDPVISGTPARRPAPATGGRPLHGRDDIKGTRARHDLPSPGQSCPVTEPPPGHQRPRHPRVTGPPPATAQGGSSSPRYGAGNTGPDTTAAAGRVSQAGRPASRSTSRQPGDGARRSRRVQETMITLAPRHDVPAPDRGRAHGRSHGMTVTSNKQCPPHPAGVQMWTL